MANPPRPGYSRVPSWPDAEGIVKELMESAAAGTCHNPFSFKLNRYIESPSSQSPEGRARILLYGGAMDCSQFMRTPRTVIVASCSLFFSF